MTEFRRQALDGAPLARRASWRTLRPLRQAWLHRDVTVRDVAIASYPRSGNLWLRVMLLNALLDRPPEFAEVLGLVPHLGRHYQARPLAPGGGRLLKSHEPYRRAYRRAVCIVRDPRDIALSYFRHLQHRGTLVIPADEQEAAFDRYLAAFLAGRHEPHGRWSSHVASWLDAVDADTSDVLLLHYEHMRDDPRGHLQRVTEWLGLECEGAVLDRAVAEATIERMRALTSAFDAGSDQRQGHAPGVFSLVGEGSVDGWRGRLTTDQARRFAVFNRELARAGYEHA